MFKNDTPHLRRLVKGLSSGMPELFIHQTRTIPMMNYLKRILLIAAVCGSFGFSWPWETFNPNPEPAGTSAWLNKQTQIIKSEASNIDTNVLRLGLKAYMKARAKGLDNKQLLTIIDYSKPSTERRMWVFDLKRGRTLFNTWVSHGKNSGGLKPTSFSNTEGSLKSSLGVFVTTSPYVGGVGYALRMKGLERGINDNAYRRDIVIHGAWYVSADTISKYGQAGRSWGCPAVSEKLARPIIDTIKDNTVVFAYYPDRNWLSRSSYLV